MLGLNGKLLDFIYPVGSYYETSDTSFNPNIAWGGTWLEDTKGRVTVALDSEDTDFDTLGKTGGSKYLQEHSHIQKIDVGSETLAHQNPSKSQESAGSGGGHNSGTTNTTNKELISTFKTGTGNSGNLQPYVVVKRWHRTA